MTLQWALRVAGAITLGGWTSFPVAAQQVIELESAPVNSSFSQVPTVAELTDVNPTDWAYQAVQSIVDRYGFMQGEQGQFRGNAPLTRYEFAAAIAEVMQSIAPIASEDDLKTLRQLQGVYGEALNQVRSRLTGLEAREITLSRSQFSTTTKFSGRSDQVITDGSADAKMSVVSRVRLNLNTSFSGRDLLVTQLEAGNAGQSLPVLKISTD